MAGTIGFVIGFVTGVVVTLVVACVVALDNDNEYLDYPPDDTEHGQDAEWKKDKWRDFR